MRSTAITLMLLGLAACDGKASTGTPVAEPGQPGASCTSPAACESRLCTDGVCCTSACDGQCQRCDTSGDGTCTAGLDSDLDCQMPVTGDWWVAPDGSDQNPGTEAAPFATLEQAWSVVEAGQTIIVRGGDYLTDDTIVLAGKSGSDVDHRIKLFAYPGERPRFHPTSATSFNPDADRGLSLSGRFLHVKGLEVYGFAQREANCKKLPAGIHAQDLHDSILEQLDVHHNAFGLAISTGRSGESSSGNLVLDSDFHHNSDPWSNAGGACVMPDCPSCVPYGGSDGLTIRVQSPDATNTVRGCRMWLNSDDGVDLWSSTGMVTIQDSWAFWNGFRPGATVDDADSFDEGGDGNGFKLGETATYTTEVKREITGSLAFQNKMWGVNDNNASCNARIYNNTTYDNCYQDGDGYCGGYNFSLASGIPYHLINDVSYADVYQGSAHPVGLRGDQDMTSIHHNSWQLGGVSEADLFLDTAGVDGPRGADGSLPALDFLHLRPGSALIDAGTTIDGYPASCNGTCDLGAYER